jgi:hypothetical protein
MMKLSVTGKVVIQALTMLGITSLLVKADKISCADNASFVCGYIVDDNDVVVESHFSVCLKKTKPNELTFESSCLKKSDYPFGLHTGDMLGKKTVISCGCCGQAQKQAFVDNAELRGQVVKYNTLGQVDWAASDCNGMPCRFYYGYAKLVT